jgi:hypothetical protein
MPPDHFDRQRLAGQLNAVGARGGSHIGTIVHKQAGGCTTSYIGTLSRKFEKNPGRKNLFPDLY